MILRRLETVKEMTPDFRSRAADIVRRRFPEKDWPKAWRIACQLTLVTGEHSTLFNLGKVQNLIGLEQVLRVRKSWARKQGDKALLAKIEEPFDEPMAEPIVRNPTDVVIVRKPDVSVMGNGMGGKTQRQVIRPRTNDRPAQIRARDVPVKPKKKTRAPTEVSVERPADRGFTQRLIEQAAREITDILSIVQDLSEDRRFEIKRETLGLLTLHTGNPEEQKRVLEEFREKYDPGSH